MREKVLLDKTEYLLRITKYISLFLMLVYNELSLISVSISFDTVNPTCENLLIKKDKKVKKMTKINFKIYYEKEDMTNIPYVLLCAGRGKRNQSKIYVERYSFSYIEGLIWNKFREYGNSEKIKISSNEWIRIVEGMSASMEKLRPLDVEEMENVLKFNTLRSKNSIIEILDEVDNLKAFLSELIEWITKSINKEKYILIIKNDE